MADFKERKQKLVNEFNQNQQTLFQLSKRQDQIIGALRLIEDIEKTEKEAEKKEKEIKDKKE